MLKEEEDNHSSILWVETRLHHQRKLELVQQDLANLFKKEEYIKAKKTKVRLNNHMDKAEVLAQLKSNNMRRKYKSLN